ncbi:hypothetical protein AB60_0993 [Escherichia coli 2-156-04_S1_C3]|nr:hypothetical protein AB60_0993 [Escherichia coli 2-156-04_S1_C3]
MFAGKKSAQIREILISESTWEEMTCLFAPSIALSSAAITLDVAHTTVINAVNTLFFIVIILISS